MLRTRFSVIFNITALALGLLFSVLETKAQNSPLQAPSLPKTNPWTDNDLIQPGILAQSIKNPGSNPVLIFNIGVAGNIKGAKSFGAASELHNLVEFKKALSGLPKNTAIVYYCGCCPFERCPNIRPAFKLVKEMGFTQAKLLNLNTNLKTNWIGMGYPME